MTSRAQYKAYVTQGRTRVKSLVRLELVLGAASALTMIIWGVKWQALLCVAATGIFGLILAMEFLALRRNERAAQDSTGG